MNNNEQISIPVGISTLIMVFIVLCLSVFATLAFVQANSDYKLSLKAAENMKKYYEADGEAQMLIAKMDLEFSQAENKGFVDFSQIIKDTKGNVAGFWEKSMDDISFYIPMNDTVRLSVKLSFDAKREPSLLIKEYKTINVNSDGEAGGVIEIFD